MKKRCTNSACRRLFVYDTFCPHCGKLYPRINAREIAIAKQAPSICADIVLIDCGTSRARTVIALRRTFDLTFSEAIRCVESCPTTLAFSIPLEKANEKAKALEEAGSLVKVVPYV